MAGGTLVDQATYYHDSSTYTGESGNQTNKWVVEDLQDLLVMKSYMSISHTYFQLVNDIDLNNSIYKMELTTTLIDLYYNRLFGHLDGSGHSIRNIIIKSTSGKLIVGGTTSDSICCYIENLNFENIIDIGSYYSPDQENELIICARVSNCNFAYYCFNSKCRILLTESHGYNTDYRTFISDCTFKIKGTVQPTNTKLSDSSSAYQIIPIFSYRNSTTFLRCHIDLDIITIDANIRDVVCIAGGQMFNNITILNNVYFTGKITYSTYHSNYNDKIIDNSTLINSYFAVQLDTKNTGLQNGNNVTINSYSFYDGDLVNTGTGTNAYNSITKLTTQQATDPSYLLAQGFPVVEVS